MYAVKTPYFHSLALSLFLVSASYAQDTNPEPYSFAEPLIVTAQKISQSTQEVGIAISSFVDDDIDELNVSAPEIISLLPNTQAVFHQGTVALSIRGVGLSEFAPNIDSPVAIYIDEVYQSKTFQAASALFDLERVDVLHGPQGTLFGRNSSGGALNYTTKKPTNTFEAGGKLTLSLFERKHLETFISGPLSDEVSGRLSTLSKNSDDGYIHNLFNDEYYGRENEFYLRGQLLWQTDHSDILWSNRVSRDKSDTAFFQAKGSYDASVYPATLQPCSGYFSASFAENTPGCVLPDGSQNQDNSPYIVNTQAAMKKDNQGYGSTLHIDHFMEDVTLTSITAYDYFERFQTNDADGSPSIAFEATWFNELHQYTQEFRLSGEDTAGKSWLIGAFFEHDDLTSVNFFDGRDHPIAFFTDRNLATSYTQITDSVALFAHKETALIDKWSLISGLRYSFERVTFKGKTQMQSASAGTSGKENQLNAPFITLASIDDQQKNTHLSYKLGLNFQQSKTQLYYGSISTGFKSGGFNGGYALSDEEFSEYKPEEITAFEIGSKSVFPEAKFQVNASVFYYDLANPQLNADAPTPPNFITTNADSSTHKGIEIETHWQPIKGLDIKNNLGWLQAEYGEFYIFGVNQAGNKVVNSPEWTFNGIIRYQYPISAMFNHILMTDYSYRSSRYLTSSNLDTSFEPGYWLVNARTALETKNKKVEIGLWVRNLFDKRYRTFMNDVSGLGSVASLWSEPRTFGLDISYQF
jgi:iron complex outermembrane receptor protein